MFVDNLLLSKIAITFFKQIWMISNPVNADFKHTDRLLKRFAKTTTDSHDFAHRLHTRSDFFMSFSEFINIPAWNLHDTIIKSRLKEWLCYFCDLIWNFVERLSQRQFCGNIRERVAGGLWSERWWTWKARIHFDDVVFEIIIVIPDTRSVIRNLLFIVYRFPPAREWRWRRRIWTDCVLNITLSDNS